MKLLLTTLHSRYIHSSLALPCLAAAVADISGLETVSRELTVNERPEKILVELAREQADIIAFSCYIWNIEATLKLTAELKLLDPDCYIILGGPEVSYGSHELLAAQPQIDAIIRGEGEGPLRRLMLLLTANAGRAVTDDQLLAIGSISFRSDDEIVATALNPPPVELDTLPSPFAAGLADMSKPLVYFESSRGCPFSCAFCLSSVETGVRSFSPPRIESDLALLLARGVGTVKFVDRTFNYDPRRADRIWEFILAGNRTSRFHFEIAADLLTEANFALLQTVPPDTFRFEIGVQSTSADTLSGVERKSDLSRLLANVRRLKAETAITVHLDLVAGLPGEDFAGFLRSLDCLLALQPDHIQVEPLKMLKGTALRKKAAEYGYRFSPYPPYRILRSSRLSFAEICRIEEISAALEEVYNSGRFGATVELIAGQGALLALLTAMGTDGEPEDTGGSSLSRSFARVQQRAAELFPELAEQIRDTLRFDYCMVGHPGHSLPAFLQTAASGGGRSAAPLPHAEIAARLALPRQSRFRTFTTRFACNYSVVGWPNGETEITFVYGDFAGGKRVLVLTDG